MGKKGAKKQKPEVASGKKGKKALPEPVVDSDSSEESSEEQVVAPTKPQKKATKPVKKQESSSSEEESEEEKVQKMSKAAAAKKVKQQDSDDEDDDDDNDDDDSSEEEEIPPPKASKKVSQSPVKAGAKRPLQQDDSDESSDDDDDEEEDEPAPKVAKGTPKPIKGKAKKQESSEEDEDSDDDDSEESDEEPPAKKASPMKAAKQNGKKKEESSDDDEEEEEDSSEEEEEPVVETKKRKKDQTKEEPSPKKAKMDTSVSENGDAGLTLFVGGVSKEATEDDVMEFFTQKKVKVTAVRKIPNRMTAFIDVKSAKDIAKAEALNGTDYDGLSLKIEKAKPKGEKKTPQNNSFSSPGGGRQSFGGDDRDSRTLFVKGLPEDATEDAVGEIFDTAQQVRLPMKDGFHRGFCFVEFADSDAMEAAMSEKQGSDLNGSSLYLDYMGAKSSKSRGGGFDRGGRGFDRGGRGRGRGGKDFSSNQGARGESKVLFVKNLSYDTDESSLKQAFDGAHSVRIPTFPDTGKPKGFAFVEFGSADDAASAFDTMAGTELDGRQIRVDFAADRNSGSFGGGGGGFRGRGGGRGFGGRGRGGDRGGRGGRGFGRGGRGGGFPNKAKGGIVPSEGKKTTFDDSD